MITFLKWYYLIQTRNLYFVFSGVFQQVAVLFDIPMMIKHIAEPLYQDYTYQGRAIGFLIRSGRILLGIFIQFVLIIVLGILILLWVLLPLVIVVKIGYILATM